MLRDKPMSFLIMNMVIGRGRLFAVRLRRWNNRVQDFLVQRMSSVGMRLFACLSGVSQMISRDVWCR